MVWDIGDKADANNKNNKMTIWFLYKYYYQKMNVYLYINLQLSIPQKKKLIMLHNVTRQ